MKIVSFTDQSSVSAADLWEKHPSDSRSLWGKVPTLHQPGGGNRDRMFPSNSMYTPQKSEMESTPRQKIYRRNLNGEPSSISFKLLDKRQLTPYPKLNPQSSEDEPLLSPFSLDKKENPIPSFGSSSKAITAGSLSSDHRQTPTFGFPSGTLLSKSEHRTIPSFGTTSAKDATTMPSSSSSRSGTNCNPLFDASSVQGATFESIFAQSSNKSSPRSSSSEIRPSQKVDSGFENSKASTTAALAPVGTTVQKYQFATYPPMPTKSPCERSTPYPPLPEDLSSPFSMSCNMKQMFSPPTQLFAGQAKKEGNCTPQPVNHAESTVNTEKSIPLILAGKSSPFASPRKTIGMGTTPAENLHSIFREGSPFITPYSSPAWNSSFRDDSFANPPETKVDAGEFPFVLGGNENSDPAVQIFRHSGLNQTGEFSGASTADGNLRLKSMIKSPVQPVKKHKASNSPATKRLLGDRMKKERVEGGNKKLDSFGAPMRPNLSKPKSFASTKKLLRTEIRRRRTAEKDCEAKAETIKRQNELLHAQKNKIMELQVQLKSSEFRDDEDNNKKEAEKSNSKEDGTETKVLEPGRRKSSKPIESPKKNDVVDLSQKKTPRRSVRISKTATHTNSGGENEKPRKWHPMIRRSMTPKKK